MKVLFEKKAPLTFGSLLSAAIEPSIDREVCARGAARASAREL